MEQIFNKFALQAENENAAPTKYNIKVMLNEGLSTQ